MPKKRFSAFEVSFIRQRAQRCCEYCKFPFDFSHDAFHIEHIIPPHLGGTNDLDNLAFACDGCNTNKWAYIEWPDPETNQKVRLFNPRVDEWNEHFRWSDDFSQMLGLTPEGRATIALLELNRPGLVNVRKALRVFGVHPAQV